MKKFIFISILFIGCSVKLIAQCTPDTTITKSGIYPKSLPDAKEDSVYDQTIQFKMPKDTATPFGTVTFDSISIVSITNIPKGLNYKCSPLFGFSDCTYPGGANGCLRLSGKTDTATYGKYFCVATLRAFVFIGGNSTYFDSKDTLVFKVKSSKTNTGIEVISDNNIINTYPVPMTDYLQINTETVTGGEATVNLYTSSGVLVISKSIYQPAGSSTCILNTDNLSSGLYILKVGTKGGENVCKVIK